MTICIASFLAGHFWGASQECSLSSQYLMLSIRGHPFMTSTRRGEGVGLRWTHVDGGSGSPAPCGRPYRKLKLESTDVILSSSHARKLASFLSQFRLWTLLIIQFK